MNFSTLKERVTEYLEDRTDTDFQIKVGNWINDTRKDLALEYEFDYLYVEATYSTSAGSAEYALPSSFIGLEDVWVGTKKLERLYLPERDVLSPTDVDSPSGETFLLPIEQGLSGDSNQSIPDYYIIRGFALELWPVPDAAYTLKIKYYAQPTDFTLDADYDHISNFHFDAVIWGAALRGAIYLDDNDKIQKYEGYYQKAIEKMIMKEKKRVAKDQRPRMKTFKDFYLPTFKRMTKMIPIE